MLRATVVLATMLAVSGIAGGPATAELLSSRPMTIIIPFTPGASADKIQSGIELAANQINSRGWQADLCMISPDDAGIAMLRDKLAAATYDCVVIGGGLRLPPKAVGLFEKALNTIHHGAPLAAI